jgi:hypothetical protein
VSTGEAHRADIGSIERDAALDLAAPERRDELFAQRCLERAQLVGEPHLEIEITVVDGAQLDGERDTGQLRGNCRESGHAEDHR